MRTLAAAVVCFIVAGGYAVAPAAIMTGTGPPLTVVPTGDVQTVVWDFNPSGKAKSVKASTLSVHGSANGLLPLDPTTPLVTVAGFNFNNTPHTLYWKKTGKTERGIGLTGTLNNELTLNAKGTAPANYLRIDVSALIADDWTNLKLYIESVDLNNPKDQERFDVWGSDSPTSFGTKLISGASANASFVSLPVDGDHYNSYYFLTTTAQGKGHIRDNVLLQSISAENSGPLPEPASLVLLALGAPAALRLRRRLRARAG